MIILKKRAPFGVVVWGLLKTFFLKIPKFVWIDSHSLRFFEHQLPPVLHQTLCSSASHEGARRPRLERDRPSAESSPTASARPAE